MEAAANTTEMHPFERAGLGKAPFRVIGAAERTYQAAPGMPVQAGGCCKYCYAGIRYAAVIRAADGNVFDVGMDCVRKVDMQSYLEARQIWKRERTEARSAAARQAAAEARAARVAQEEQLATQNMTAFAAHEPELWQIVQALRSDDGFAGRISARALRSIQTDGDIDVEAERDHTAWKLRELYAAHRASGYVGQAGEKLELTARYLGVVVFESSFGVQKIYKFEHQRADGSYALVVWKTQAPLAFEDKAYVEAHGHPRYISLGSELVLSATVKLHDSYNGVPQTKVVRPKFKDISVAT